GDDLWSTRAVAWTWHAVVSYVTRLRAAKAKLVLEEHILERVPAIAAQLDAYLLAPAENDLRTVRATDAAVSSIKSFKKLRRNGWLLGEERQGVLQHKLVGVMELLDSEVGVQEISDLLLYSAAECGADGVLKERTLSSAAPRHARSVQDGKEEININAQTDGLGGENRCPYIKCSTAILPFI
ncbi:MAG: hypothetical protein SGPRY_011005, partial [Prymnesium sp.]